MGSTSYDEARDPTDPRWAGASWYGPTTGEYWIVNPREYADPRKHGPGYSQRMRSGEPPDEAPIEDVPRTHPPRSATAAEPRERAWPPEDPRRDPRETARRDPRDEPRTFAARPAGAAAHEAAQTLGRDEPFLDSLVRPGPRDPLRRLGLVLLAWAPVGIAAAAVIGQLTGCAAYSVACDGTDPYLPWIAQAIIVGLLLLAAPMARVFAAGTLGLVVGLVPATAFVIALGGAGSPAAPPVLAVVLVVAWVIGAAWGLRHLLATRSAPVSATGNRERP